MGDTPELNALRVPLIPCINLERSNMVDVCCRDPSYKDPWPQGMNQNKNQNRNQNQNQNQNIEYEDDYGQETSGISQDYSNGGGGGLGSSQDYGDTVSGGSQDYPDYPDYPDYQETRPDIDIRNQHSKKKKKGNAYG